MAQSIYHQILGVPAPTVVLTEEEKMEQAHLKGFISSVIDELKNARDKAELIDVLDWAKRRINNGL